MNRRNSDEDIERMLSVKDQPNWPTSYKDEDVDGGRQTTITRLEHFMLRWAKKSDKTDCLQLYQVELVDIYFYSSLGYQSLGRLVPERSKYLKVGLSGAMLM